MKSKDKEKILRYLQKQPLMSLATKGGKTLWSATVYFVADDNLDFYFMSSPDTIHSRNILKNRNVALTVADSSQWPEGEKFGVQASGSCSQYKNVKGLIKMLVLWNKKFHKKPAPPLDRIKIDWPFYKIEINKLKVFDSMAKDREILYRL